MQKGCLLNQTRGYVLALASTLVFSTTGILIKYILVNFNLPLLTLAAWRCGILSVTMLIVLGIFRPGWLRLKRQDIPFYLGYGLVGVALSQTFWINSVNLNGAALATVLFYISPAFVIIYSRLALDEPITRAKQAALALIFAGSALVAQVYDPTLFRLGLVGVLVGLTSGMVYSGYTIFSKEATRRHHPWVAMTYAFFIGTLFLSLTQWRANVFILGDNLRGWGALILLALGPTLGGYALYTLSLRDLSASIASLILPLEMVFTGATAYMVFGEALHPLQILGGALIAFSILLLRPRGKVAAATARKD
jgi:drug/metabolite transporter (DMT)-like permease